MQCRDMTTLICMRRSYCRSIHLNHFHIQYIHLRRNSGSIDKPIKSDDFVVHKASKCYVVDHNKHPSDIFPWNESNDYVNLNVTHQTHFSFSVAIISEVSFIITAAVVLILCRKHISISCNLANTLFSVCWAQYDPPSIYILLFFMPYWFTLINIST